MLTKEDLGNIETLITRSKGGFMNPVQNNVKPPFKPRVEMTKQVLHRKFNTLCEELGIESAGRRAGLIIMDDILETYSINILSEEDTIESAVTKMVITEAVRNHSSLAEAKKQYGLDTDEIDDSEISKLNASVDKVSTKKLDENIAKNVADATTKFITDRNARSEMIKSAYQKVIDAKKKITGEKDDEEDTDTGDQRAVKMGAAEESYKYALHKDKQRTISLFESIVQHIASQYTNEAVKASITDASNKLDMDKIIDISSGVYGAMETLNQYNIVDINESVIKDVLNTLK